MGPSESDGYMLFAGYVAGVFTACVIVFCVALILSVCRLRQMPPAHHLPPSASVLVEEPTR